MKKARARILWIRDEYGNRLVNPPVGSLYYPLIYLDETIIDIGWSIKFLVTGSDTNDLCEVIFSMLVNNQASSNFFNNLTPGTKFTLNEGKIKIAKGIIQEIID